MTADAEPKWYIVHTYSGFENRVRNSLLERAEETGMHGLVRAVVVPIDVPEKPGAKRIETQRSAFPGYVLVHAVLTEDSYQLIKGTPKVTGFAGGGCPKPLTEADVRQILHVDEEPERPPVNYEVGDVIRVREGPFTSFNGLVQDVDAEARVLNVAVSIFGRSTVVDLKFSDVEIAR